jgi:hypothetical protein
MIFVKEFNMHLLLSPIPELVFDFRFGAGFIAHYKFQTRVVCLQLISINGSYHSHPVLESILHEWNEQHEFNHPAGNLPLGDKVHTSSPKQRCCRSICMNIPTLFQADGVLPILQHIPHQVRKLDERGLNLI